MRVAYACHSGHLEHIVPEVDMLARRGVEVHLVIEVTPRAWSHNAFDLPSPGLEPGLHDASGFLRQSLPPEMLRRLESCAGLHLAVFAGGLDWRTMRVASQIRSRLNELGVDVVHTDGETIRACLWMLPLGRPIVVNVHEPVMPTGMRYPHMALAKRLVLARAAHAIVHSHACMLSMETRWKGRTSDISLAPMGVMANVAEWCGEEPVEAQPNRVVLWGLLSERKGIETLLKAAPQVAQRIPGFHVVIAGRVIEGYEIPQLPKLGRGGRIEIREGYLSNADLCRLVRSSALALAPYVDAMQSSVVLTSFALGRPIVASDTGGLSEQVVDGVTGWLVPPRDASALARTLIRVLSDASLIEAAQREISARWSYEQSWAEFGDTTVAIYRRLLA